MQNKFTSFLNTGNVEQYNTTIVDPKVDPLINTVKQLFYKGQFKLGIEQIEKLISEYADSSNILQKLLIFKAEIKYTLHKKDQFIRLIEYIEDNYKPKDLEFLNLKIDYYTILNKNEDAIKQLDELILLKSEKEEYYDLLKKVITDPSEALKIYEEKFCKSDDPNIINVGTLLYAKEVNNQILFQISEGYNKFLQSLEKLVKVSTNRNIVALLHLSLNKAIIPINRLLNNMVITDEREYIKNYISIIDELEDNILEFGKEYREHIINLYLLALITLSEWEKFKEKANSFLDDLSDSNYFQYLLYKEIINDELILKRFEVNKDYHLIQLYINHLYQRNIEDVIRFIDDNKLFDPKYIKFLETYLISLITTGRIDEPNIQLLNEYKKENIDNLRIFLNIQLFIKNDILDEDFQRLFEETDNITSLFQILESIKIFFLAEKWQYGFELALCKEDYYPNLIQNVLIICSQSKKIYSRDFELFVSKIKTDKKNLSPSIAHLFHQFGNFRKAFDYYKIAWDSGLDIHYIPNLFNCLLGIHQSVGLKSEEKKILEDCVSKITKDQINENFQLAINLVNYYIFIEKNPYRGFKLFNQSILSKQIDEFEQKDIDSLIGYLQIDFKSYNFTDDNNNIVIHENGQNLVCDIYDVSESMMRIFNLELVPEYKIGLNKKKYINESGGKDAEIRDPKINMLSGMLVMFFLPKSTKTQILPIDETFKEDPLKFFYNIIKPFEDERNEMFKEYSSEKIIPFHHFESDYNKYSELIQTFLNRNDLEYFSGYNIAGNYPKILTISSIFFLDHFGYFKLAIIKRPDINIQRSIINWFNKQYEKNGQYENIVQILEQVSDNKKIDDSNISGLVKEFEKLQESLGIFDYNALILGLNNNQVQIISDDSALLKLLGLIENKIMPTNSFFLIFDLLKDESEDIQNEFLKKIHSFKYKYILPFSIIESLKMLNPNISYIQKPNIKTMIKIAEDYGWLEEDVR